MIRSPAFTLWILCGGLVSLTASGCAGFQLGNQTLYRPDIRTVYVPMFESESFRVELGPWLTEAVVKEIEQNTPYKVVHTRDADSVLTGKLVREQKRVLIEDPNDEPRVLDTEFVVQVTWFDRRGELLMQSTFNQSSELIPEAGQSLVSAHQRAIRNLARQIVGRMEANYW